MGAGWPWLQRTKDWPRRTSRRSGARRLNGMEGQAMTIKIRQAARFDPCDVLGEVISETSRAYIFRRPDGETGFISKNARPSTSGHAPWVRNPTSINPCARRPRAKSIQIDPDFARRVFLVA